MDRLTIEVREDGGNLHGTILQEGRASSGGRSEVFAPGSVSWPGDGIDIRTEHRGQSQGKAFPHRTPNGELQIRATATEAIRAAIKSGKRYMSVEFHPIEERTVQGGIREILKAIVMGAALVANPEYDSTSAELRAKKRPRVWL